MRKLLSILLAMLFGLPVAAPLLALGQTAESRLPACCRRAGDHHCAEAMSRQMDMAIAPNPSFAPLPSRCPFTPSTLPTYHLNQILATAPSSTIAAASIAQHILPLQSASIQRPIHDPSRPRRGPPASNPS